MRLCRLQRDSGMITSTKFKFWVIEVIMNCAVVDMGMW